MRTTASTLLLLSIVYALAIVWGVEWLLDYLRSRTFGMGPEVHPRWVRTALAFAPFALFSLWAAMRRPPHLRRGYVAGLLASLALWVWYYADGFMNTGGGANIGLGIIMMLSPVPVFLVLWLFARKG
jgi:hypothetical protein